MAIPELLRRFEDYLLGGELRVGDRLPGELELAARFGCSRGTLREVMTHLAFKGVLERRTSQGTILRTPAAPDIAADLAFELRMLQCGKEELKAARETLERSIGPAVVRFATPAHLDTLTRLNQAMRSAHADTKRADALDLEFHLMLFGVTGNRLLTIFAQTVAVQFAAQARPPFADAADVERSGGEHEELIAAIAARDVERYDNLIAGHIGRIPV